MIEYGDDISPLKNEMGLGMPVGGLRASEVRRIQDNYIKNVAPLEDRMSNMQMNMMRLRSQDLAFKRAQQAFDEETKRIQAENAANDPALYTRIDEILGDPFSTGPEQQDQLLELGRKNPAALNNVPLFNTAFNQALKQANLRSQEQAKENAKMAQGRNTIISSLLQSNEPGGRQLGLAILNDEQPLSSGIDFFEDSIQRDQAAKRDAGFSKAKQEAFDRDVKVFDSVKFLEPSDEEKREENSKREREGLDPITRFRATMSNLDRKRMFKILADSTDQTLEEVTAEYGNVDGAKDEELAQAVEQALGARRAALFGTPVPIPSRPQSEDLVDTPAEINISFD